MRETIEAIQKWFMEKQKVKTCEEIKVVPGSYIIPVGDSDITVEISKNGYIKIIDYGKKRTPTQSNLC